LTTCLAKSKREELLVLRTKLDPFKLAETVNRKLEAIWDLAHYHYKPKDIKKNTKDLRELLSNEEKETLEEIAQVFGIEVYVKTHQDRELINIAHG
jgi:hypothetical protein